MTGLIHDLGKILYLKGCDKDGTTVKEQWGIVTQKLDVKYQIV